MADPAFLLDTNICIYVLDGTSVPARARIEAQLPRSVVTSAVAYAELVRGLELDLVHVKDAVEQLFTVVTVLPFDRRAALAYRDIPFQRGRFGHLIAAHALALDLILVTNNERDFADVPGLRVENWTI